MIRNIHSGSGSWFLPIPDPKIKKAPDPGSGSATLGNCNQCLWKSKAEPVFRIWRIRIQLGQWIQIMNTGPWFRLTKNDTGTQKNAKSGDIIFCFDFEGTDVHSGGSGASPEARKSYDVLILIIKTLVCIRFRSITSLNLMSCLVSYVPSSEVFMKYF
jgi:hypothetical protein